MNRFKIADKIKLNTPALENNNNIIILDLAYWLCFLKVNIDSIFLLKDY